VVDDFTDPWSKPSTVLMLHGNAESGAAWYGWVPELARRHRVVRPDMRGFGQSTPMPREFPWSLDGLIDDYCRLMDVVGVERFHLVGAKIGGTIARAFAARRPERVATLIVVGSPTPLRVGAAEAAPARAADFEKRGVEPWARESMGGRLGSDFPPAGVPDCCLDPGRFHADDRMRRHPGRRAENCVSDPGHHDRRQRARQCRGNHSLAADDPALRACRPSWQFLSRGC